MNSGRKPKSPRHPSDCQCDACAQQPSLFLHWKERRRRRLQPYRSTGQEGAPSGHAPACACPSCLAAGKGAVSRESDDAHTYWRVRRQLRHGWDFDDELQEYNYVFSPARFSHTPNPVKHFHGITPGRVRDRKPRHWPKLMASRTRRGWVMRDENGNERIRFMRPNPNFKGVKGVRWDHIRTGYWLIRDGQGNYLDGQGNIVAPNILFRQMTEDQKSGIHVPYSGISREFRYPA